jgi:thiosulfate dehydrogenase [quinone] large subunit
VSDVLHGVQRDPRWVVLVLRAYLAFTFIYAGLSKIRGRSFFDPSSPASIHATLLAVRGHSPIGGLLGPVEHHSFAFGLLIAIGETAVGVGMLLGLLARVAALGGMLIPLSLFLTVSWNATPWYTGADIVYLLRSPHSCSVAQGRSRLTNGWRSSATGTTAQLRERTTSPVARS